MPDYAIHRLLPRNQHCSIGQNAVEDCQRLLRSMRETLWLFDLGWAVQRHRSQSAYVRPDVRESQVSTAARAYVCIWKRRSPTSATSATASSVTTWPSDALPVQLCYEDL